MLQVRIDIVNKKQYEELDTYQEIKILFPRSQENLKRDFRYLDLDYENYTIQDTHIKECEFIDRQDPAFSTSMSTVMNNLIIRASESGFTTPFQDMKKLYNILKDFNSKNKDKLLAIMEANSENITNIKDAIKYAMNIDRFELINACDNRELAKKLVHNFEIDIEDLMKYSDLNKLGNDYAEDKRMTKTEYGFLKGYLDLSACDVKENEDEEEFE